MYLAEPRTERTPLSAPRAPRLGSVALAMLGGVGLLSFGLVGCGDSDDPSTPTGSGGSVSAGGSGGDATGGAGAGGEGGGAEPLGPGDHVIELSHDGLDRSYRLHVPPSYSASSATPLVVNFHGFGSNAFQQELFSLMSAFADEKGFVVAYPEGIESSWNSGPFCCGQAIEQQIDDVGFARTVVADIATRVNVDEKRVFATGMSNGGFLSHRLACEAADLFAAVAPVDGLMGVDPPSSCVPSRPIPIIHFYGSADPLVDYQLGIASNDHWVDTLGCADAPQVTFDQGAATCETWSDCDADAAVTFCTIEGMGHCWPGQAFCPDGLGAANEDISANEEMWAFFEQHPLP